MSWARWTAVAVLCLLFVSCGLLDPATQQSLLQTISDKEASGTLGAAEAAALRELVQTNGVGPWWQQGLGIAIAAASAYFGVQLRRGPVATKPERLARAQAKIQAKNT